MPSSTIAAVMNDEHPSPPSVDGHRPMCTDASVRRPRVEGTDRA